MIIKNGRKKILFSINNIATIQLTQNRRSARRDIHQLYLAAQIKKIELKRKIVASAD